MEWDAGHRGTMDRFLVSSSLLEPDDKGTVDRDPTRQEHHE